MYVGILYREKIDSKLWEYLLLFLFSDEMICCWRYLRDPKMCYWVNNKVENFVFNFNLLLLGHYSLKFYTNAQILALTQQVYKNVE